MADLWLHPAALAGLGLLVGCLGALVGVGGGFMLVPYFLEALAWPTLRAVGTSLGVVVLNALSGTVGYARQRRIDYGLGLVLAAGTVPGTIVGRAAAQHLNGGAFRVAFGAVVAVAAVYLLMAPQSVPRGFRWFRSGWRRSLDGIAYEVNPWFGVLASVAVGFLAALFGVGGGFLHVPMMILLYGMPPHVAAATSTFALGITSVAGAIQYADVIDGRAFLYVGAGAVVGAQVGTAIAPRMPAAGLRVLLALVLVGVSLYMVWTGFRESP